MGTREPTAAETAGELAAQSRTLRNSIISLAVFFGLTVGLLLAVPGLRSAAEKIHRREAAAGSSPGSCSSCSPAPAT